ncbi:MAG: HEPN domain-containing protein [bacterium]
MDLASDDLATAEKILDVEYLTNIVAFHSQQCLEKSFKAILEENNHQILKIHDLITLYSV